MIRSWAGAGAVGSSIGKTGCSAAADMEAAPGTAPLLWSCCRTATLVNLSVSSFVNLFGLFDARMTD